MIQVISLQKAYGGESLFEGASFTIGIGERVALVGRNGHGKSTLIRMLVGDEEPDGGSISFSRGCTLGYLQQHIRFEAPTILAEACRALAPGYEHESYRVEKILSGLGIDEERFGENPSNLSGGFQLRLHLTKALVGEPDFLLLDEPTNYLDIVSMRWLTKFLRGWRGGLLIVSHDRGFLDEICTHSMAIHRKKFWMEKGSTEKLFESIVEWEEVQEKTRLNEEKVIRHMERFVERFGSKATKAKQAQSRVKAIARIQRTERLENIQDLDFSFSYKPIASKRLLWAKDLEFCYEATQPLIKGVSLDVGPGERIAIIGKNGQGKTTLLRLLAKELQADHGEVAAHDKVQVGYFGQTNIDRLNPDMTVEEEIHAANPKLDRTQVRSLCGAVMFSGGSAEKKIQVLSGGERSRVLLGKILAHPTNVLLLDEPTHHLDVESVEGLMAALEDYPGSVILVTHSEEVLRRVPHRLIICQGGRQKEFLGPYDRFLEQEGWDEEPRPKKKISKKDEKRQRAERIRQNAELTRPLKKKQKEIERDLELLEPELKILEEQMEQGASENLAEISRQYSQIQNKEEELWKSLDQVQRELAKLERETDDPSG